VRLQGCELAHAKLGLCGGSQCGAVVPMTWHTVADLIFNFHKAYYILDELMIAGMLGAILFGS
jgi:hypothetical protein